MVDGLPDDNVKIIRYISYISCQRQPVNYYYFLSALLTACFVIPRLSASLL